MLILLGTTAFINKQTDPWKPDQLMETKELAAIINDSTAAKPLIINIGPVNSIKGAIKIGPVKDKEHLTKLKSLLSKEDKNKEVVIYCGCCPFAKCPNIRPAFELLNKMKFTRHKLLNLPHNLKADWINFEYPMEKKEN
jgi:hypothetical protein